MEISYWISRWKKNKIGWHMEQPNPHLLKYWHLLGLNQGDCVLVPLCGKSNDLRWLADKGLNVIGIDVSEKAAVQFFKEGDLKYTKSKNGNYTIYEADNIQFWIADFFKVEPGMLPYIDAIFDRAALVALPREKRKTYASVIFSCCSCSTSILLSVFEYKQHEMNGPPFAVMEDEVRELYSSKFEITIIHEESIFDQVQQFQRRGLSSYMKEKVYLLEHL